ncbi:MAG: glutamine synthetase [Gammaproteobacteria bacterium]|nr:glutamine synthetase [Gammaproteobacteria bacterium]
MDCLVYPVAGTLVRCPWLNAPTAQVLVMLAPEQGPARGGGGSPRLAVARIIDKLQADNYQPVMAVELEFYLMDGTSVSEQPPRPVIPRGKHTHVYSIEEVEALEYFFDDLYRFCDVQGLPAETAISEFGPGQLEITLIHRTDALRALDEAIMYRRLVKGVAAKHGLLACFMAKPFAAYAGSGMHLHLSLLDEQDNNVFAAEEPTGTPLLRHAIAGMGKTAADAMALFAPHANSYRRFCANSYAPVTPTWGVNNRTVSLRVPTGPAASRHIEHRIAGADANAYLAAAGILAGAHHGLKYHLDPGPPVTGDGYTSTVPSLPQQWLQAIEQCAASPFMREYFGDRFIEIYSAVKRTEHRRYMSEITAQDYDWYLQMV